MESGCRSNGEVCAGLSICIWLLPELKAEVADTEGNFERQLTKARFEEAKTW